MTNIISLEEILNLTTFWLILSPQLDNINKISKNFDKISDFYRKI